MALTTKTLSPEEEARRQSAQIIADQAAAASRGMTSQTRGVVDAAYGNVGAINAQPSLTAPNVDRGLINVGASARPPQNIGAAFPSAPQFNLAGPVANIQMPQGTVSGMASGVVPSGPVSGENVNVAQDRTPIKTPYGTIYATADQQKNWNASLARDQQEAARKELFQQSLARAQEIGRQNTAAAQLESQQRYGAFRQGMAERQMQDALDPTQLGGPQKSRGLQAMVEMNRWAGAAKTGQMPKIGSDVETPYGSFRPNSRGGYSALADTGMPFGRPITPSSFQPARPIQPAYSPLSLTPQAAIPSATPRADFSLNRFPLPALFDFNMQNPFL